MVKDAHPTKDRLCPHCGHHVTHASNLGKGEIMPPVEGDLLLCIECGKWGVETGDGLIRLPTDLELYDIAINPDCHRAEAAWAAMNQQRIEQFYRRAPS
jgi:hypothetical protein